MLGVQVAENFQEGQQLVELTVLHRQVRLPILSHLTRWIDLPHPWWSQWVWMLPAGCFAGQHAGGLVPFLAQECQEEGNFEGRIYQRVWNVVEGYQIDQAEVRCL